MPLSSYPSLCPYCLCVGFAGGREESHPEMKGCVQLAFPSEKGPKGREAKAWIALVSAISVLSLHLLEGVFLSSPQFHLRMWNRGTTGGFPSSRTQYLV